MLEILKKTKFWPKEGESLRLNVVRMWQVYRNFWRDPQDLRKFRRFWRLGDSFRQKPADDRIRFAKMPRLTFRHRNFRHGGSGQDRAGCAGPETANARPGNTGATLPRFPCAFELRAYGSGPNGAGPAGTKKPRPVARARSKSETSRQIDY